LIVFLRSYLWFFSSFYPGSYLPTSGAFLLFPCKLQGQVLLCFRRCAMDETHPCYHLLQPMTILILAVTHGSSKITKITDSRAHTLLVVMLLEDVPQAQCAHWIQVPLRTTKLSSMCPRLACYPFRRGTSPTCAG